MLGWHQCTEIKSEHGTDGCLRQALESGKKAKNRSEGHCSRASEIGIDKVSDGAYSTRPNLLSQETMPCSDPVHMSPTPPRVSSTSTISPSPSWWPTITTTSTVPALAVGLWPLATHPASAPGMTWAMCKPVVQVIGW